MKDSIGILILCALTSLNWGSADVTSEVHDRSKRSVADPSTNVTFLMEKTNGWENVTKIKVSQKVSYKVTAWVPVASTSNLRMEFSTPVESDGAVMALCTPRIISVGPNLGFSPSDKRTVMKSTTKDNWYDQAYIDFGDVLNSNVGDSTTDNYKIILEFEAYLLKYHNLTYDTKKYWVSYGASYNDKANLYVSQDAKTAETSTLVSGSLPDMSMDGPASVIPGTTAVWRVKMVLKDAVNDIIADIYMPFNASDLVSLCSISVGNSGKGFACYDRDVFPNTTYTKNKNYPSLVSMGTIDLGSVVNTAYWDPAATADDKTLVVEFAVNILNNTKILTVDQSDLWMGFAVQLQDKNIWSAQKNFVVSQTDVGTNSTPDFSIDASTKNVPENAMTAVQINMTLPMSSSERYVMELELPANGSSPMEACDYRVRYVGFNYPCFKTPTVTYSSQNNNGINDYVRLDFGVITNTGQRSDNDSNRLVVEVIARMRPGAGLSDGQAIKIVGGVMYGGKAMWVGCVTLNFQATPPSVAPQFRVVNLMNVRDSQTIYAGGQTAFYADMKLPLGSYYPNIQFMASAPADNSSTPYKPLLYLCSVRIRHMGSNFPCNNETREADLQATLDPAKEKLPDLASLNLTDISNVGFQDFGDYEWGSYNDSVIRFEAVVGVADITRMMEGKTYYVKFGVQYAESNLWVARAGVVWTANTTDLQPEDASPLSGFERASPNNSARIWGGVEYHANAWLSPRTVSTYAVEAFIPSNKTLTVCRIGVKKRGANVACPYPKPRTLFQGYDFPETQIDWAYHDIGIVANYGQRPRTSDNKEEDLLQVSVVIGVHPSAQVVAGENVTFSVALKMGNRQLMLGSGVITLDARAPSPLGSVSPTTYLVLNSASSHIVIGGAKTFFVDIYIPPDTMGYYSVEAYAPSNITHLGKMAVCDVHIASAAWNLPCVNDTLANITYPLDALNRTFTRGVLEVGYVQNIADSGAIEHKDNKLRVEFTVMALEEVGLAIGDVLHTGGTAEVDGTQLWVGQTPLKVAALVKDGEKLTNITVTMKPPETPAGPFQRIGEVGFWKAIVKMPPMTGKVTINVTTPYSKGKAHATVVTLRLLNSRNVPCAERSKPTFTKTSAVGNNQNTFISATFIATHTGASDRYQFMPATPEDDLVVAVDLQIADHIDINNATAVPFTVGALVTDGTDTASYSVDATAYALRDGNEKPLLQQHLAILPNDSLTLNPKDDMTLFVHFNHSVNSSAHAFKVAAKLSFPPLVAEPRITEWSFLQPNSTSFVNYSFIMNFDAVQFVDNVTTTLSVKLDPNAEIPIGRGEMQLNIYLEISYSQGDRSNWPTPINSFSTEVTSVQQNFFVPECSSVIRIDALQDCQTTWQPTWRPYSTAAAANWARDVSFPDKQALQFSLGNRTRVTALKLRLLKALTADLSVSLTLSCSDDGKRWQDHVENGTNLIQTYTASIAQAGSAAGNEVTVTFTEGTVVGRFIRVYIKVNVTTTVKRFPVDEVTVDLIGCYITNDADLSKICKTPPPKDIFERGLLMDPDAGALFVCIITAAEKQASCSVTRDLGTTWSPIDEEVLNINYYIKGSKKLMASNRHTRMCSRDGGQNWFTIPDAQYDMEVSDINNVLQVQAFKFDGTYAATPTTPFTNAQLEFNSTVKFGMNSDGVHVFSSSSWTLVSYWNNMTP